MHQPIASFIVRRTPRPRDDWRRTARIGTTLLLALVVMSAGGAGEVYRTDTKNPSAPWYTLKSGVFPPADAAHLDYATLIALAPNQRTGIYRLDSQAAEYPAVKRPFELLPYATVFYHGAPADWRDIPPRTHVRLHLFQDKEHQGQFFNQVTACADDFSVSVAEGWTYRIEEIKAGPQRLVVSRQGPGVKPGDKVRSEFMLDGGTLIWKGRELTESKALAVGQSVVINQVIDQVSPTIIYRCAEIWLDEESRTLATARQRAKQRCELLDRGLPGYVSAVDNQNPQVTVTFFYCGYPEFFKDFQVGKRTYIAVGYTNLMTIEPAGGQGGPDNIPGVVVSITEVPAGQGSSGVQIVFKPEFLAEGFRPARIVRVCPEGGQGLRFITLAGEERVNHTSVAP
jgi:hypothetical protein